MINGIDFQSENLRDLIEKTTRLNRLERISINQVIMHPFLTGGELVQEPNKDEKTTQQDDSDDENNSSK